jgi:hypothetical protein
MFIISSTKLKPVFYLWFTATNNSVFQLDVISTRKAREKLTGSFLKNT